MTELKPSDTTPTNTGDPAKENPGHGEEGHVHGEDCAQDDKEVFETLTKLGPLFERAAMTLRPRQMILETQRGDRPAFFRHFKGQRLEKFSRKRIFSILQKEIFDRQNIFMAHLFMVMWNEQNRGLYSAMREQVETINEDVESIEKIENDKATEIVGSLIAEEYEKEDIYICVCINEVRFSEEFIQENLAPPSA